MSYKNQFRYTGRVAKTPEELLNAISAMGKDLEREFQAVQDSGSSPSTPVAAGSLPIFANNAAAISGGLKINSSYRTGGDPDTVCVVH